MTQKEQRKCKEPDTPLTIALRPFQPPSAQCFSNIHTQKNHLKGLISRDSDSTGLGQGLRTRISTMDPGDADAASLQLNLE